ncbi:M48 family metallopeptidase [Deefgea salmonis]|uniref:M48 family metallopeptidase n=1 Tax=Deefgea salmonis TaxID=2875502 RepID=A0ABS8BPA7_9NEIS|nr:SprT family zinc-dependent metalloprotease [Deefgea salmonis]MCB5197414.1 M48 family metallopeptidase [Deefgea salmonis]
MPRVFRLVSGQNQHKRDPQTKPQQALGIYLQYIFKNSSGDISYQIKRSPRRRSIGLKIDAQGLTVILPQSAAEREAERVIELKLAWIRGKLAVRHDAPAVAPPSLCWGASALYLGESFMLQPALRSQFGAGVLSLCAANDAKIAPALIRFYQRSAQIYLAERVGLWSERMALQPRKWLLSSAKTRWGSCTAAGDIRLNWRLMQAPASVIDYVVIHELAHLAQMNHSARFWAIVAQACPNWKTERAWLKQHALALLAWG